jgi:WD40 repeat protein
MIKISSKPSRHNLLFFKNHERVAITYGNNIHVYNTNSGDLIKILFHHQSNIRTIAENGQNILILDEEGLLSSWNSENLDMIASKVFPNDVTTATIASNFEWIYYTREKDRTIVRTHISNFGVDWEYSEELIERPKSIVAKRYRLRLSRDDRFLIEHGERNIFVYNTENLNLVNRIRHSQDITCVEVHPNLDSLIVGDKLGKITHYYGAFQIKVIIDFSLKKLGKNNTIKCTLAQSSR